MYHVIVAAVLSRPVDKIPGLSEMRRLQAWILAFLPDRDQLLFKQRRHIYMVFPRVQAEGDSANMGRHTEIHFILMFGLAVLNNRKADKCFRYVVCDQLCPYFLFDVFRLVCVEIAQPNGIFELAEGTFYGPPGKIEEL